jgi:hypothetical protein
MFKFLLALIFISTAAFAQTREEAQGILLRFKDETSFTRRLDLLSAHFLGLPYGKGGPLGEGPSGKYDQDPLYRFDTFDCTTYVETIMALAHARDVDEFEMHINNIRYKDGVIDYLERNHFTDLQWIPFNTLNGYLREINAEIAPEFLMVAQALVNFPGWLRSHKIEQIVVPGVSDSERENLLMELKSEARNYSEEYARVSYIPIKDILARPEILKPIPHGALVNFVRPNWDLTDVAGTHQNISHQGFLFWTGKNLFLRHASTSGTVENVLFLDYLKRFRNHATLKGVHIMKINPQLP